ncbi:MAG: hypothetical protein AAF206_01930 [Bacteroidota bacterium]
MKYSLPLFLLLFCFCQDTFAQNEQIRTYQFAKGQVFDIIFLTTKKAQLDAQQTYLKNIFPVAQKEGYHGLKGFSIPDAPTQGNYHPRSMIFGYWNSLQHREQGMTSIEQTFEDFHQQRRNIWSTFAMTYFDLKEDLDFSVNLEKYNVSTAFWGRKDQEIQTYMEQWKKAVRKQGGRIIVKLEDGVSPFGYTYQPDVLIITEWDSEAAFSDFDAKSARIDRAAMQQINQFHIQ